jgi:hypothetical protein
VDGITSTLLAGTVIIVGRMAESKPVTARIVIGIVGTALALSLLGEANPELGKMFAALILVSAVFVYGVPILKKTGLIP